MSDPAACASTLYVVHVTITTYTRITSKRIPIDLERFETLKVTENTGSVERESHLK